MQIKATQWQPAKLADSAAELLDRFAIGEIDEPTLANMLSVLGRAWLEMQKRTLVNQVHDAWDGPQHKGGKGARDSSKAPTGGDELQELLDDLFTGTELAPPSGEGGLGQGRQGRRAGAQRDPSDGLPLRDEGPEGCIPKDEEDLEGRAAELQVVCECGHIRAWHVKMQAMASGQIFTKCQRCKCPNFKRV